MVSSATITAAPDLCFNNKYLDSIYNRFCASTLEPLAPVCGSSDSESNFSCCTSEWDYGSMIESCISVHATAVSGSCDDYGFPITSGRAAAVSACSWYIADGLFTDTSTPITSATGTGTTSTSPSLSAKVAVLSFASASSTVSTSSSGSSSDLSASSKPSDGNTASSSSASTSAPTPSTASKPAYIPTVSTLSSPKSSTGTGADTTAAATSASTNKSIAAGLDLRASTAVGLFTMLAVVLFRTGAGL